VRSEVDGGTGQSIPRKQPGGAYLQGQITSSPKRKFRKEDEIARTSHADKPHSQTAPETSRDGVWLDLLRAPEWPTINPKAHGRPLRAHLLLLRGFTRSFRDFVGASRDITLPGSWQGCSRREPHHATPID
jgi:hypothetical protein